MNVNKYWNQDCGKRLREELNAHGYKTNTAAASFLNLSKEQVSYVCNGRRPLQWDVAQKLSKEWNIPADYFYGFGSKNKLQQVENHQIALAYLKSLGIECTPGYYWHCSTSDLLHHYDGFKKYFTLESKTYIDKQIDKIIKKAVAEEKENEFTFNVPKASEFIQLTEDPTKTDPNFFAIRYKDAQTDIEHLTKQDETHNAVVIFNHDSPTPSVHDIGGSIAIYYKLTVNGEFKCYIGLTEFRDMLAAIDGTAKALVNVHLDLCCSNGLKEMKM